VRILRVSYRVSPEPGGKERHVECLTREQLKRGHDVALAFRRGAAVDGSVVLPLRPITLSRVLASKSDVLAFAAETAGALPRVGGIDLVHLHGDHVEAGVLGRACRRLGVPLVLTVHGALNLRNRRFVRWAFGGVGAFIALGSRTAGDLVVAGVDPDRILTISSGLDLAQLDRFSAGPAAREPGLIVSVGSLETVKNHALLIEAIHALRRTRPEIRLVIAGDGPERDRLRRLAGTDHAVTLAGPLAREDVYRLVRRAQVFVLASRRLTEKGEGVPTAALEALALGTPAVLSSEASLDPVVPDRGTYRTFASGSVDDLVRVLAAVLDDEESRLRMSELGRRAAAALDWTAVAHRIEDWYRVALDADRRDRDA
jgi:glycosyltransferase involved in cell wall biosynthesis